MRIEGFEIYGMGNGGSGGASGVELYAGGADSEVVGNNIHDIGRMCTDTGNGQDGIFVQRPRVLIEGNLIHDIGRFAPGENGCSPGTTGWRVLDHGIYADGDAPGADQLTIRNNIFYSNVHGWSIHLYPGSLSDVSIFNNTFAFGNPYRSFSHIIFGAALTNLSVTNNLFYDTGITGKAIDSYNASHRNTVVSSNLTRGNGMLTIAIPSGVTLSSNMLLTDALFVSPGTFDFHLTGGSPALNTGLTIPSLTRDFAGVARPQGAGYDLGACELVP